MKKRIMTVLKPDGTEERFVCKSILSSNDYKLAREAIAGTAEALESTFLERFKVRVNGVLTYVWCDEDGYLKRLPINEKATALYNAPSGHKVLGTCVYFQLIEEENLPTELLLKEEI